MLPDTRDFASALLGKEDALQRLITQPAAPVLAAAAGQGVLCLLARALRQYGCAESMRPDLVAALREAVHEALSVELVRRRELVVTLEALLAADVRVLLFKGAAFAYTHYLAAHLRPRVDTDVLVHPDDCARAMEVLYKVGYERQNAVERDAIFTQAAFSRRIVGGVDHVIDLHWRVSVRPIFRDLVDFEELAGQAAPIPALGAAARTPGAVHSLLLACVHPAAHHHGEWPLIWLNDVRLLAERLTPEEWARFTRLALEKRVFLICRKTLQLTASSFDEASWLATSGVLKQPMPSISAEPSAAYLVQRGTRREDLMLDLAASPGIGAKCRLLLSHAFPDVDYMRQKYGASSWLGLVSAYGRRISGAGGQLARNGTERKS